MAEEFHFTQALTKKRTLCRSQRKYIQFEPVVADVPEFLVVDPTLCKRNPISKSCNKHGNLQCKSALDSNFLNDKSHTGALWLSLIICRRWRCWLPPWLKWWTAGRHCLNYKIRILHIWITVLKANSKWYDKNVGISLFIQCLQQMVW